MHFAKFCGFALKTLLFSLINSQKKQAKTLFLPDNLYGSKSLIKTALKIM